MHLSSSSEHSIHSLVISTAHDRATKRWFELLGAPERDLARGRGHGTADTRLRVVKERMRVGICDAKREGKREGGVMLGG